jgi:predicted transcriptional regulator
MTQQESVDKILKEIFIEACAGLRKDRSSEDSKEFTQKDVAFWMGVSAPTVGRYLSTDNNNSPDLIGVMEVLYHLNKRHLLLKLSERSNCQAARFIREHYADFTINHQIVVNAEAYSEKQSQELVRMINEHQSSIDHKMARQWKWTVWIILTFFLLSHFGTYQYMKMIHSTLSEMAEVLDKR